MWEDGVVKFVCEDLPQHGLVLVPPASEDYATLLADIQNRLERRVEGSPPFPEKFRPRIVAEDGATSAILLNRSAKGIAGLQAVWRFETETGRSFRHSIGMLSAKRLLIPFEPASDAALKLYRYWNVIFPGSKRYLAESGMAGDNTDVRPPDEDEKWRSGIIVGGSRGGGDPVEAIRRVTLALDAVFFEDGEFAGPDGERIFDQTVADVEAHRIVARIARDGHHEGLTPAQVLAAIEKVTGVAPERPPSFRNAGVTAGEMRAAALQNIAYQLAMRRRLPQASQEQIVFGIMSWGDAVVPNLRKG